MTCYDVKIWRLYREALISPPKTEVALHLDTDIEYMAQQCLHLLTLDIDVQYSTYMRVFTVHKSTVVLVGPHNHLTT